ncbi:MAG: DUF4358 domain-containing protein [Lachnospiraceae bacterium]|nr:DUF4358 domain-containing protein [Lachnospiraceae bacterium]
MKRMTLLLSILLLVLLAACDNKTDSGKTTTKAQEKEATTTTKAAENKALPAGVTPQTIEAAIAQVLGDGYVADMSIPEDELPLSPLGEIDMSKLDTYVAKQNAVPSVHADTVIIVKCKDASYADRVVDGFNAYYKHSREYFTVYPLEPFKLMQARIYKADDIVMYIIAGAPLPETPLLEPEQMEYAKAEYDKIDNAVKEVLGFLPQNLLKSDEIGDSEEPAGAADNGAAIYDGANVPEE